MTHIVNHVQSKVSSQSFQFECSIECLFTQCVECLRVETVGVLGLIHRQNLHKYIHLDNQPDR